MGKRPKLSDGDISTVEGFDDKKLKTNKNKCSAKENINGVNQSSPREIFY